VGHAAPGACGRTSHPTDTSGAPRQHYEPTAQSVAARKHPCVIGFTDYTAAYEPWKAIDGNLATAWVEGVAGPGIGETLTLDLPGTAQITHIGIAVGYDSDQETFAANNRVQRIALTFSSGYHIDQTFHDVRGRQEGTITPPEEWLAETDTLTIAIADVYPGTRYDDTPIAAVDTNLTSKRQTSTNHEDHEDHEDYAGPRRAG
jgi:hypothetical protein